MASSGSFNTSGYAGRCLTFNWGLASQDIANNRSTINWEIRGAGGDASMYYKAGNFTVVVNGTTVYSSATRINLYAGTVVANGSITIGHNADGTKSFSASASAGIYTTAVNVSGSGSWAINTIPRQANLTSAPDFNDEANPVIKYSNPAGNSASSLQACITLDNTKADIAYRNISKTGTSYSFSLTEAERNVLRNGCLNASSRNVMFKVKTVIGGNTFYSSMTKKLTIINGAPTFTASQISYKDTNNDTQMFLENDQLILQNKSTMQVSFTSASAKKGASIKSYKVTLGSVVKTFTKASTIDYGTLNYATNQTLTITVTDSRGFTATASKTVTFIDYHEPIITASIGRKNNYENESILIVKTNVSEVIGTNFQNVTYKYKKVDDFVYSPTYMLFEEEKTLYLDKDYAWNIVIMVRDTYGYAETSLILSKGKFIMFVDTKKLSVGVNCFPKNESSLEVSGLVDVTGELNINGLEVLGYEVVE